ncbi:MAG: hypothetical protein K6F33_05460, partial [Bacteroidales bacterium]|nr:hypothetical protein [Bacteroidales bacterium]
MKRIKLLFLAASLMAMPLTYVSCGDDNIDDLEDYIDDSTDDTDDPTNNTSDPDNQSTSTDFDTPLSKSEYTIIFYGHGGGDLDPNILENIENLIGANSTSYSKVHATVQYKMSSKQALTEAVENGDYDEDLDVDALGGATFRFFTGAKCDFDALLENNFDDITMEEEDLDIASTDNLVDYIKWAVSKAPAEKYILVLSDHGGGYSPEDELPSKTISKGFIYDDGAKFDHFTAEKLVTAINEAGIRPEVIYLDACLMNTIEYQYELKDYAKYLIMSTFSVPGPGGDYTSLVNELASNTDIEKALSNFCDATMKRWDEVMDEESNTQAYPYSDMSIINTAQMDQFGHMWTLFTEQLISAYQEDAEAKAAIDEVTANMMPMECGYALYDMNFYADQIINAI